MKVHKGGMYLAIFLILLATGFAFYYYNLSKEIKQPTLTIVTEDNNIRPFKFVNQEGDTITNTIMKGKVAVVEFFFTTCMGICPIMNENMTKVYQTFKNNDDVVILSHTVDPKRDSVSALKAYSQRFDVDSKRWHFLTGDKRSLYDQAYYSYMVSAIENRTDNVEEEFVHSNMFILVDQHGRIRLHLQKENGNQGYDGTNEASVAQLIKDIQYLLTEEKDGKIEKQ
jgi:protein SCO1/2